jgi:hypothetical protein
MSTRTTNTHEDQAMQPQASITSLADSIADGTDRSRMLPENLLAAWRVLLNRIIQSAEFPDKISNEPPGKTSGDFVAMARRWGSARLAEDEGLTPSGRQVRVWVEMNDLDHRQSHVSASVRDKDVLDALKKIVPKLKFRSDIVEHGLEYPYHAACHVPHFRRDVRLAITYSGPSRTELPWMAISDPLECWKEVLHGVVDSGESIRRRSDFQSSQIAADSPGKRLYVMGDAKLTKYGHQVKVWVTVHHVDRTELVSASRQEVVIGMRKAIEGLKGDAAAVIQRDFDNSFAREGFQSCSRKPLGLPYRVPYTQHLLPLEIYTKVWYEGPNSRMLPYI